MISVPKLPSQPAAVEYFWFNLPYAIPGIFTFILGIFLFSAGVYFYRKNKDFQYLAFGLYSVSVGALGLVLAVRAVVLNKELILFSNTLLYPFVMLNIFGFFYIHYLTGKRYKLLAWLSWLGLVTYFIGLAGVLMNRAFLPEFHSYYFGQYPVSAIWLKPWIAVGTFNLIFIFIPALFIHLRRYKSKDKNYVAAGVTLLGLLFISNGPSLIGYSILPLGLFSFLPLLLMAYGTYRFYVKDMNDFLFNKNILFYFIIFIVSSALLLFSLFLILTLKPTDFENINWNPWIWVPMLSILSLFILATNIAAADTNSKYHQVGAFSLFASGFYSIQGLIRVLDLSLITSLRIDQLCYLIFSITPPLYLRFLFLTINKQYTKRYYIFDFLAVSSSILALTDLFFEGFYQYSFARVPAGGIGATIFGVTGFIGTALAVYTWIRMRRKIENKATDFIGFSILLSAVLLVLSLPATKGINFYSFGNLQFIPAVLLSFGVLRDQKLHVRGYAVQISRRIALISLGILPLIFLLLFSAYRGSSAFDNVLIYILLISLPIFLFVYIALMIFTRPLTLKLDKSFQALNDQKFTVEQQSKKLKTLNDLTNAVNSTIEMDEVLKIFINLARHEIDVTTIALTLIDYKKACLKISRVLGDDIDAVKGAQLSEISIPMEDTDSRLVRIVNSEKVFLKTEITEKDINRLSEHEKKILSLYSIKSILVYPVRFNSIIIGALILVNSKNKMNVNNLKRQLLKNWVEQISTAIHNAQLFEEGRSQQKLIKSQKDRLEKLSEKLSRYLSPQLYKSIFEGTQDVTLASYRKKLTVFFSDIKGFTEITDSMESENLTILLNEYLNEMSAIALKYEGTIDKFIGDAIMVFFGDPESKGDKTDALNCVSMAIEMRNRMQALNEKWKRQGISELSIRMGINTGYCTVGNIGSNDRMDYTIIGGQVNLASRLESLAEPDQILITSQTYALVNDRIFCREKSKVKVKGIAYPVQTYEVIDFYENLESDRLDNHIAIDMDDKLKLSVSLNSIKTDKEKRAILKSLKNVFETIKNI